MAPSKSSCHVKAAAAAATLLVCFVAQFVPLDAAPSATDIETILRLHNAARATELKEAGAGLMYKLQWDDRLAAWVQNYYGTLGMADSSVCKDHTCPDTNTPSICPCTYSHLPIPATDYKWKQCGENWAWSSSKTALTTQALTTTAITSSFNSWNGEKSYQGGHYTQINWGTSRYIGCMVSTCGSAGAAGGFYFVCDYYPPGNNGYKMIDTTLSCTSALGTVEAGTGLCVFQGVAPAPAPAPAPATSTADGLTKSDQTGSDSASDGGLSGGAIAGIVIGVIVLIAAVAGGIAGYVVWHRRQSMGFI